MKIIHIKCHPNLKRRYSSFVGSHPAQTMPPFCPTYIYVKLSRSSWVLVLSHSFGSSRGHRAGLVLTIVRLSWLILGSGRFETIYWPALHCGFIFDLFCIPSMKWQFLCCMVVRLTQHFSLHFLEEGTAGPKHPPAYSCSWLSVGNGADGNQRGVSAPLWLNRAEGS